MISLIARSSAVASFSSTIRSTVPPRCGRPGRGPRDRSRPRRRGRSPRASWRGPRGGRRAGRALHERHVAGERRGSRPRRRRGRRGPARSASPVPARVVLERVVGASGDGVADGLGRRRVDHQRARARSPSTRGVEDVVEQGRPQSGAGPWASPTSCACRGRPPARRRRSGVRRAGLGGSRTRRRGRQGSGGRLRGVDGRLGRHRRVSGRPGCQLRRRATAGRPRRWSVPAATRSPRSPPGRPSAARRPGPWSGRAAGPA